MTPGARFEKALGTRALWEGMLLRGDGTPSELRLDDVEVHDDPDDPGTVSGYGDGKHWTLSAAELRKRGLSIQFDDAATFGAAREVLRKVSGEPELHLVPGADGSTGARVWFAHGAHCGDGHCLYGMGHTEKECLAAAAEALVAQERKS